MRDPSLHIGLKDFIQVLKKVGIDNPEVTARAIFEKSIPYHIKNRYLVKGNTAVKKRANKIVERKVEHYDFTPEQFYGLLTSLRQMRGVKFQQKLTKGSSDWNTLIEVHRIATEFITTFNIVSIPDGYKSFINNGLDLMGKSYGLNKFKYYASKIHTAYEAELAIAEDETPKESIEFWNCWKEVMTDYTGNYFDLLVPEKFIHMVYAKQDANEADADYTDWIEAQFEGLAYLSALPELGSFHGDNAKLRYEKHMAKKTQKTKKDKEDLPADVSAEHIDYFAALKLKRESELK
jgi:hypothetical protein